MRIIVSMVFIFLMFGNQITAQDAPKIEVIKFHWSVYIINEEPVIEGQPVVSAIRPSAQTDPMTSRRTDINRQLGERDIEDRSDDLNKIEKSASRSVSSAPKPMFVYELKVKNTDSKTIKSFIWEYQSRNKTESQSVSDRQFLCVEKIKADAGKTLKIISQMPPTNVVDAASAEKNKSDKNFASDILINRIDYTDGTIWQNPDWDAGEFILNSLLIKEKLKNNDCVAL